MTVGQDTRQDTRRDGSAARNLLTSANTAAAADTPEVRDDTDLWLWMDNDDPGSTWELGQDSGDFPA